MNSKNGCYVNIDPDVLGYVYHGVRGDFSNLREKLDLYLEGYKNHGISDLLFNVLCQSSIVPSEIIDQICYNYNKTEENGIKVDYKKCTHALSAHMAYSEMEDPVGYLISESKKNFNVWLSYRMNDCHESHNETSALRSDQLYYYAKKNGKFIGDHVAGRYYGECLDYSDEHIRSVFLSYIKETVFRYHPYGIELDFLREPFCFDYENTPDCCEIMTDFMASVKDIATEYEKTYGSKLRILVRLVRDIENNRIFGFDVKEWIRRGLVDVLSPCSRWQDTDSDMPIGEWVALTEGSDVEIAAGLEFYLWGNIKVNGETAKGLCAQYFDEGSKKIYLYNHYREAVELPDMTEWNKTHPGFVLFEEDKNETDSPNNWATDRLAKIDRDKAKIWEASENAQVAKTGVRRHVLTFTETSMVPKGGRYFNPLPLKVEGKAELKKLTGDLTDGNVTLYLGIKKGATPPTVKVDGFDARLIGKTEDAYFAHPEYDGNEPVNFTSLDYYAYDVKVCKSNYRNLEFFADSLSVEYLEFRVDK